MAYYHCDLDNYDLAILYDDDAYAKSLSQNPLATRPVILVDDYRKLSLKDLRKLLKIPYNRERIENASRKMLEDVQAFLK
ncbi:5133_t:CDS:2 [Dentiscutata erythropus]|uniref:5133_t:CDS:1 n=1 Tax=Dentiscutata erythropus TaxID=1348616 RepID=A0A9N9K2R3_9GLOM|nr:5133_t:CDS:2 [Dentiscutata erythropus]